MFKHADRGNTIELAVHLAVIAQVNFDRQTGTQAPRILGLLARNGHPDPTHAVALGGEFQQLAPAAADVEQPLHRSEERGVGKSWVAASCAVGGVTVKKQNKTIKKAR